MALRSPSLALAGKDARAAGNTVYARSRRASAARRMAGCLAENGRCTAAGASGGRVKTVRKSLFLGSLVAIAVLALPASALGGSSGGACGGGNSGWERVDRDAWWFEWTVPGFEQAGIDVYDRDELSSEFDEFAVAFGLADGRALMDFVLGEQFEGIDKNANDWVCIKDVPNTPGHPGYIFMAIDDNRPG